MHESVYENLLQYKFMVWPEIHRNHSSTPDSGGNGLCEMFFTKHNQYLHNTITKNLVTSSSYIYNIFYRQLILKLIHICSTVNIRIAMLFLEVWPMKNRMDRTQFLIWQNPYMYVQAA